MVEENSFLFFGRITWTNFFTFLSYGYSKERFVWSLISAVGIFCLGSGATIVNGVQNLWTSSVIGSEYILTLISSAIDILGY